MKLPSNLKDYCIGVIEMLTAGHILLPTYSKYCTVIMPASLPSSKECFIKDWPKEEAMWREDFLSRQPHIQY